MLLAEIREMLSEMSSRASASEAAQPPQASVSACLNQVVQSLNSWEATGGVALNNLEAAASAGDSATAAAQLELLRLTNREARTAVTGASACEASTVTGSGADANGDGVPDSESSTGGIQGLNGLEGDDESVSGSFEEDLIPDGASVEEEATSDVITSPAVTQ